jgi:iron(III) transport system ATP-binding protein
VMNNGTIEQIGSPLEVYREPKSLFVADFIGETNKFPAVIDANGLARLGDLTLHCQQHGLPPGSNATVMVRPNDIAPHGLADGKQAGAEENLIEVRIESMEFLGSFWRTHLRGQQIDSLVADFSINAERRLKLSEGMSLQVELPKSRMLVFP